MSKRKNKPFRSSYISSLRLVRAVMRAAPFPLPSSDGRNVTLHWGARTLAVSWRTSEKLGTTWEEFLSFIKQLNKTKSSSRWIQSPQQFEWIETLILSWQQTIIRTHLTVDDVCRVSHPPPQSRWDGPALGSLWSYPPRPPFLPHTAELHDVTLLHKPNNENHHQCCVAVNIP